MLPCDPIFLLLGLHSAALNDAQADVDDVAIPHGVSCSACVRRANEEAHREGLETFGRMQLGSVLSGKLRMNLLASTKEERRK